MGSSSCNHNNTTAAAAARPNATHALRCACRYKVVKQLGDGTYGNVWKAINRQTNEVVSEGCRSLTLPPRACCSLVSLAGFPVTSCALCRAPVSITLAAWQPLCCWLAHVWLVRSLT